MSSINRYIIKISIQNISKLLTLSTHLLIYFTSRRSTSSASSCCPRQTARLTARRSNPAPRLSTASTAPRPNHSPTTPGTKSTLMSPNPRPDPPACPSESHTRARPAAATAPYSSQNTTPPRARATRSSPRSTNRAPSRWGSSPSNRESTPIDRARLPSTSAHTLVPWTGATDASRGRTNWRGTSGYTRDRSRSSAVFACGRSVGLITWRRTCGRTRARSRSRAMCAGASLRGPTRRKGTRKCTWSSDWSGNAEEQAGRITSMRRSSSRPRTRPHIPAATRPPQATVPRPPIPRITELYNYFHVEVIK